MMTGLAWAEDTEQNEITFDEGGWGLIGTYGSSPEEGITINNVIWQYADARNEGSYAIDGAGIMLRKASESYLQATIPGGVGSFSFQYRKAETNSNKRQLELIVNGVQKAVTPEFGNTGLAEPIVYIFSYDVNTDQDVTIKIKNVGTTIAGRQTVIDNIKWTAHGESFDDTILHVSPLNLSRFCHTQGVASSPEQNFVVQGWNLDNNVEIKTDDNSAFEISLSADRDYSSDLSLTQIDGQVEITPIYVRMKTSLEAGEKIGSVTVSSSGAEDRTISLEGEVYDSISMQCYFVTFEDAPTQIVYGEKTIELSGINWKLNGALVSDGDNDWRKGFKSARLHNDADAHMTMDEDKLNGLGTLSFFYRRYGSDSQANVSWKVEYSRDQGTTWIQVGSDFTALASDEVQLFEKDVNVPGDVRVRILRAGLDDADNGKSKRINIDNILLSGYDGDAPDYDINPNMTVAIGNKTTATITGDSFVGANTVVVDPGNLTPFPNAEFIPEVRGKWRLSGSGTATITISTTNDWFAWVVGDEWNTLEGPLTSENIEIDLGAKNTTFEFMTGSGTNPTLPVELSSFTVALNPKGSPVVTWVTQTETGVNGFYIYRGENKNLDDAIMISNLIPATNSSLEHSYSFEDTELYETGVYYYWLNVSDLNGHESYHGPIKLSYNLENSGAPDMVYQTGFKSIYPNPFNPNANISFELAEDSEVMISVYNTRGQIVRSFAPFSHNAGYGSIVWDGKDDSGTYLASGIYFFRMTVGAKNYNRKALMLK